MWRAKAVLCVRSLIGRCGRRGVQGRGERPLRAGGGSGEECGTTLPREQGLQGECGTMTLPPSAQECPPHRRPRRAGFRGSAPGERQAERRHRRCRSAGCLVSNDPTHPFVAASGRFLRCGKTSTHFLTSTFGGQTWQARSTRWSCGSRAWTRATSAATRRIAIERAAISRTSNGTSRSPAA